MTEPESPQPEHTPERRKYERRSRPRSSETLLVVLSSSLARKRAHMREAIHALRKNANECGTCRLVANYLDSALEEISDSGLLGPKKEP